MLRRLVHLKCARAAKVQRKTWSTCRRLGLQKTHPAVLVLPVTIVRTFPTALFSLLQQTESAAVLAIRRISLAYREFSRFFLSAPTLQLYLLANGKGSKCKCKGLDLHYEHSYKEGNLHNNQPETFNVAPHGNKTKCGWVGSVPDITKLEGPKSRRPNEEWKAIFHFMRQVQK